MLEIDHMLEKIKKLEAENERLKGVAASGKFWKNPSTFSIPLLNEFNCVLIAFLFMIQSAFMCA